MGVEQREGRRLRQCGTLAEALPTLRCFQLVRMPRTSQSLPSIYRQEDGPGQRQCTRKAGALPQGLGHAHDTRGNQQGVRHGAEQHHAAHMLTTQTLAQYERVLRADGHDEPQAQGQALEGNG